MSRIFKNILITLLLFLIPVAGVIIMWLWAKWPLWIKWLFSILLILPVILIVTRIFIAEPFRMVGQAMMPTLNSGQYIIIEKFSQQAKFPQRGEIVVYRNPRNQEQVFVNRVIGLPNESILIKEGKVYINELVLDEPYLSPKTQTNGASFLTEGQTNWIPSDSYVVLGDSRTASFDSSKWGFVPRDLIVGRYWFKY